jgi:murein L,D-transpeptidase YafK
MILVVRIAAALGIIAFVFNALTTQNEKRPNLAEPSLVVRKYERLIELFDGEKLVKTYKMVLGFSPTGDKFTEGDGRTPEGEFYVFAKNPKSKFHLSLGLSYPGPEDAERGLKDGLISKEEHDEIVAAIAEKRMPLQKTRLGGEIYIHGGGTASDWTEGCVALDNVEMTELFEAVPIGTKVTILP